MQANYPLFWLFASLCVLIFVSICQACSAFNYAHQAMQVAHAAIDRLDRLDRAASVSFKETMRVSYPEGLHKLDHWGDDLSKTQVIAPFSIGLIDRFRLWWSKVFW